MPRRSVSALEVFGLSPLGPALRQCAGAIAGDAYSPPSRWGASSMRILEPWLSLPLWLGRTRRDRKIAIYNLPNRNVDEHGGGYSVRVTDCRDYRGKQLTYDGHLGTDFAVPVGTEVTAVAGGVVRAARGRALPEAAVPGSAFPCPGLQRGRLPGLSPLFP